MGSGGSQGNQTTIGFYESKQVKETYDYLNEKGEKVFDEIFIAQKKRIYKALLNSTSEEVLFFDKVIKKIING